MRLMEQKKKYTLLQEYHLEHASYYIIKKDFYLQGWQRNKFYPDFIALTKKGNILALEWKGEHLTTSDETKYKDEIGKIWGKLGKDKLHFFLVHNGNVEEVLTRIKEL